MSTSAQNLATLKQLLISRCGFEDGLFQDDYEIGQGLSVAWAGFAHRPFDARSVCVAAIESTETDVRAEVIQRRRLGAPVVFAVSEKEIQIWRPGRDEVSPVRESLSVSGLKTFVRDNAEDLRPRRLYDAKTLGRLPDHPRQLPLFVDPTVVQFAEHELGDLLTCRVIEAIELLEPVASEPDPVSASEWVFKATFRTLAAKILKDKKVPGFITSKLGEVEKTLQRVEKHYGSKEPLTIRSKAQFRTLREVVDLFTQLGDLRNLTTESLADVYEQALITKETRKLHGTHKTPSCLVDYVVWHLAD